MEFFNYESMDETGVKIWYFGWHGGNLINYKHD
jgi:hypothetical protein